MKILNKQQEYWKSPDDKPNKLKSYLKYNKRSEFLIKEISSILKKENTIIELGCNVGRNLHYLFKDGYKNLSAIEINDEAIKVLFKKYSELIKIKDNIKNSTIEEQIKEYPDKSFDLVFSMAVLMHLPYESDFILREMVRISKKYILIIENERPEILCDTHFPREYKFIFENLGLKQIKELNLSLVKGLETYKLRIFKKDE